MRKHLKKLIAALLTLTMCFTISISSAFAQENKNVEPSTETAVARGAGYGSVIYPGKSTVTINRGYVDTVSYTGTYGLFGSSGVVVLRFTNVSNGDLRSWTFICDNSYRVEKLNYQIPAGTYNISLQASTVKNLVDLKINFS